MKNWNPTLSPLSPHLNQAITKITNRLVPAFNVSDEAPSTYKELKELMDSGETLTVYKGGSDFTIFASPEVNWSFRAWHDWTHWKYEYDFSVNGEMFTCSAQLEVLSQTVSTDIYDECSQLLMAEVIGQRLYYEAYGEYVSDQRAFVLSYVRDKRSTLNRRW